MPENLLRPVDVAELLGVSYECACQLMKGMRRINLSPNPHVARPRWGVTESELKRWMEERTERPDARMGLTREPKQKPACISRFDPNLWEIGPDGMKRMKRKRE